MNESPRIWKAALLVIGDEILSGRTQDKNVAQVAAWLNVQGIRLSEVRVVADDTAAIVAAVNALRAANDYLFTTGGIGPTHDDITAECVAKAFGVPIDYDPRAVALLQQRFKGPDLNEARMRMTRIPHGADLVTNKASLAPGFWIGNVIVMAGVPAIMESMLLDVTQQLITGARMNAVTIRIDRPEADIADLFRTHQGEFPGVVMGSYPAFSEGQYRVELVLRSTDPQVLEAASHGLLTKLRAHGIEPLAHG